MRPPEVVTATEGNEIVSAAWNNEEIGILVKCSRIGETPPSDYCDRGRQNGQCSYV